VCGYTSATREQSARLRAAAFHYDDAINFAVRPMSKSETKIADLFTKLQSLFEDGSLRLAAARVVLLR
jgi:hypothetical protein